MSTIKVNSIEPANAGSEDYFLARAWVNFDGTGTVAIRASGNVSSIADDGTGLYTVNFSAPVADANYSFSLATNSWDSSDAGGDLALKLRTDGSNVSTGSPVVMTTSAVALISGTNGVEYDPRYACVSIHR